MRKHLIFLLSLLTAAAVLLPVASLADCDHTLAWRMIGESDHQQYCTKCGEITCTGDHTEYCDSTDHVCMECGAKASDGYEIHHIHQEWEGVSKDSVTTWTCEMNGNSKDDHHAVYCSKCGEVAMNEHHMWNASGVCADCGASITEMAHVVYCTDQTYCLNCESSAIAGYQVELWVEHDTDLSAINWTPKPDDDNAHVKYCPVCGGIAQETNHCFSGNICEDCGFERSVAITNVPASAKLKPGKTYTIEPRQDGLDDVEFSYSSSNKKVAKVNSDGVVTALKAGTAVITVTSSNGETAEMKVTVQSVAIKLNKTKVTLKGGNTFQIKATQSGTAGATFTYKTSSKKVVKVDKNGLLTAVKPGTATITVTSSFGETATVKITVK